MRPLVRKEQIDLRHLAVALAVKQKAVEIPLVTVLMISEDRVHAETKVWVVTDLAVHAVAVWKHRNVRHSQAVQNQWAEVNKDNLALDNLHRYNRLQDKNVSNVNQQLDRANLAVCSKQTTALAAHKAADQQLNAVLALLAPQVQ